MKTIHMASIFLILFFAQPLMAKDAQEKPKIFFSEQEIQGQKKLFGIHYTIPIELISRAKYQYQLAIYLLLSGDYLSSSQVSDELLNSALRDRSNLLLRLSDNKLFYTSRNYPTFAADINSSNMPDLIPVLDVCYKMKQYEECLRLTKNVENSSIARYFEGMSLLGLDRLEESNMTLEKVSTNDDLYPYAKIALSQIEVFKRDLKAAKGHLKALLAHPLIKKNGLAERVSLIFGQIHFEHKFYSKALDEFSKISLKSAFAKEAIIGKIWSLIKLGRYGEAIQEIKDYNLNFPNDALDTEVQIALGYSYIKINMANEAIEVFQTLLESSANAEAELEKIIEDKSLRNQYISFLMEKKDQLLSRKNQYYFSMIEKDPSLSILLEEFTALQIFKKAFIELERKINDKEIYLIKTKIGLMEGARRIKKEVKIFKDILQTVEKIKKKRRNILLDGAESNKYFAILENEIINSYQETLEQQVGKEVKGLLRLILWEWIDQGMIKCQESNVICAFMNTFRNVHLVETLTNVPLPDKHRERILELMQVLEIIAEEIIYLQNGKKMNLENKFFVINQNAEKKAQNINETLEELNRLKKELKKNLAYIDSGSKLILEILDPRLREKLIKIKYELLHHKSNIASGWNMASNMRKKESPSIKRK